MLKFLSIAPDVYGALDKVNRTGWVRRGVKDPETVKEHTEALLELIDEISHLLSEAELDGLAEMLEVHDWPEVKNGDEVILELDPDKRRELLSDKFQRERLAMESICASLPNGGVLMNFWLRMETSDDPAARLGKQLDKYQAVEKSLEYEQQQGIRLFQEFLEYAERFIEHPVLLKRLARLQQRWEAWQA